MIKKLEWTAFKAIVASKKLLIQMDETDARYRLSSSDEYIVYECSFLKESPASADQTDFETNFKAKANRKLSVETSPFGPKTVNGQKLFRRKYGYDFTVQNGSSTFRVTVPYAHQKVNQAEIVGAPAGLTCNFKVIDSAAGTYSGVANAVLNQFGFNVKIPKDFYKDHSPYDAELYAGMQIEIDFVNSGAECVVGINVVFHEVVAG